MSSKKSNKVKFFTTKYERHLIMPYDYMIQIGPDEYLDVLLDHGFTTKLELNRFEDEQQNIVEFVQDLQIETNENGKVTFKDITEFKPSGEDHYH